MQPRIILSAALLFTLGFSAQAQQKKESDKLDIKKLEDKYWAAKDDDFSVVQNRTFSKANRFHVTLLGGIPINDPYSKGNTTSISVGYHLNERHGIEFMNLNANYSDNDSVQQFVSDHNTIPNHNVLKSQMSLQYSFIPLYAKMSLLDQKIIYFDMGVSAILGQSTFEQLVLGGNRTASAMHYGFSVFQHYFFNEHIAVKIDYRNTWTSEERFRYKMNFGEPESARSLGTKSINDTMFMFGITYFH